MLEKERDGKRVVRMLASERRTDGGYVNLWKWSSNSLMKNDMIDGSGWDEAKASSSSRLSMRSEEGGSCLWASNCNVSLKAQPRKLGVRGALERVTSREDLK